ncbi:unnamed protein product [Urochloa humidicola]
MAPAAKQSERLRVHFMPFPATSHILPITDLAFHLSAARPDEIEAIVAVTPANAPIVQSGLARREPSHAKVEVATYAFPAVSGLPPGVENMSTVKATDMGLLVDTTTEAVMRPALESLIMETSADAIISDLPFFF